MPPLVAAEAGEADTARPAVMVAAPSSAPVTAAATARRLVEMVKVKGGRKADSRTRRAHDRPAPGAPGFADDRVVDNLVVDRRMRRPAVRPEPPPRAGGHAGRCVGACFVCIAGAVPRQD